MSVQRNDKGEIVKWISDKPLPRLFNKQKGNKQKGNKTGASTINEPANNNERGRQ